MQYASFIEYLKSSKTSTENGKEERGNYIEKVAFLEIYTDVSLGVWPTVNSCTVKLHDSKEKNQRRITLPGTCKKNKYSCYNATSSTQPHTIGSDQLTISIATEVCVHETYKITVNKGTIVNEGKGTPIPVPFLLYPGLNGRGKLGNALSPCLSLKGVHFTL